MDLSDIRPKLVSGRVYPEFLELPNDSRVVNMGCGNGPQAVVFKGQFSEMIGIDINEARVRRSLEIASYLGIEGYSAKVGDVENTELSPNSADVVLAIDVIEHVRSYEALLQECKRVLKPGGTLLITYPTMHDKYFDNQIANFVRFVLRRSQHDESVGGWDPDHHNNEMGIGQWIENTEKVGFKLSRSRATTMFPPLHLLGVKKFWFTSNLIHRLDSYVSSIPFVRNYGQTLLCQYDLE